MYTEGRNEGKSLTLSLKFISLQRATFCCTEPTRVIVEKLQKKTIFLTP